MTVRFEMMPEHTRHMLSVHAPIEEPRLRDGLPVRDLVRRDLPVQEFQVGPISLRVAFDPYDQVLYVGERGASYAMRRAEQRARDADLQLRRLRAEIAWLLPRLKGSARPSVRQRARKVLEQIARGLR